jgi:hypothetical protein
MRQKKINQSAYWDVTQRNEVRTPGLAPRSDYNQRPQQNFHAH